MFDKNTSKQATRGYDQENAFGAIACQCVQIPKNHSYHTIEERKIFI